MNSDIDITMDTNIDTDINIKLNKISKLNTNNAKRKRGAKRKVEAKNEQGLAKRMRKPTKRQLMLARELIENPRQTLKESLTKSEYAKSIVSSPERALAKPSFIELMDRQGMTDEFLNSKLYQGLEATKVVVYGDSFIEPPDFIARHKYLDTALRVKRHLTNDTQINIQANDYKVIIED